MYLDSNKFPQTHFLLQVSFVLFLSFKLKVKIRREYVPGKNYAT